MLQEGRRRGWGGFYQARRCPSVDSGVDRRAEEDHRSAGGMEQRKSCKELLEERQMRRYWRAQRRAKKGNRRTTEEERTTNKAEKRETQQKKQNTTKYQDTSNLSEGSLHRKISGVPLRSQTPAPVEVTKTLPVKKPSEKCRNTPEKEDSSEGYSQSIFWKEPIPEIDCRDLAFLTESSNESSEEEVEEKPTTEEVELTRPVFLITEKTAKMVGSGISSLENKTGKMTSEVEKIESRIKELQDRVQRLESRREGDRV